MYGQSKRQETVGGEKVMLECCKNEMFKYKRNRALCSLFCGHQFSFFCFSIYSASSALVCLAFYTSFPIHPLQVFVAYGQKELLALRCYLLLGRRQALPLRNVWSSVRLSQPPLEYQQCYSAIWIYIRAVHQSDYFKTKNTSRPLLLFPYTRPNHRLQQDLFEEQNRPW